MLLNVDKMYLPKGTSVKYLVSRVEVQGYRNIGELYIDIWYYSNAIIPYAGNCSYEFWGPAQFGPYRSSHGGETPELAFQDAMSGITNFDRPEYPNEVVFFVEYSKQNRMIIYDGNGERVTKNEVAKRRSEYLTDHPIFQ